VPRSAPLSPLLARALVGARRFLKRADKGLFGVEVVNGGADMSRGPETWDPMRRQAEACFVLSTGRTATATLTGLLGTAPGIDAHHEPEPRLVAASYLAWVGEGDDAFWRDAVRLARDRAVFAAHKRGKVYFESSHRLSLLAGALAAVYPRSRFLLVARRPEDFIVSGVRRGFYSGHPWDYARPRPQPGDPAAEAWSGWSSERRCAWLWRATYEHCLAFGEALPAERFHVLRCEDLFARDYAVLDGVFRFVGTEPPPRRRLESELARKRNRQNGLFPWGREPTWSADERAEILGELDPLLARLGYR